MKHKFVAVFLLSVLLVTLLTDYNLEYRSKDIRSNTVDENIEIKINANLKTKPVIFGVSQIPYTQDYALTGRFYDEIETIVKRHEVNGLGKSIEIQANDRRQKRAAV